MNRLRLPGLIIVLAYSLRAGTLTPDFSQAPVGWFTDRYAPAAFANVGSYQGLNNVIGISIDEGADGQNSRAPVYNSAFYNTQGDGTVISGGVGDGVSAMLYVPESWSDPTLGSVRTDEWLQTDDNTGTPSYYAIFGFTNYGGHVSFRGYDAETGVWTYFNNPVNYNAWNELSIVYVPGAIDYYVNGQLAGEMADAPMDDHIAQYSLEAYNYSSNQAGSVENNYTAYWANVQDAGDAPEPAAWMLMAAGLGALALVRYPLRGAISGIFGRCARLCTSSVRR